MCSSEVVVALQQAVACGDDQASWHLAFGSHKQGADGVAGEAGAVHLSTSELICWREQDIRPSRSPRNVPSRPI